MHCCCALWRELLHSTWESTISHMFKPALLVNTCVLQHYRVITSNPTARAYSCYNLIMYVQISIWLNSSCTLYSSWIAYILICTDSNGYSPGTAIWRRAVFGYVLGYSIVCHQFGSQSFTVWLVSTSVPLGISLRIEESAFLVLFLLCTTSPQECIW